MISEAYKELNRKLHATNETYGISGQKYIDVVRHISNHGRLAILDYGCGKATLAQALGPAYRVTNYDPCVKEYEARPEPHDIVVCTDVMEHIEPEYVDAVLKDVRNLTKQVAFFAICIAPAQKFLEDGRNAHISLLSIEEWKSLIRGAGFEILNSFDDDGTRTVFGLICK